MDFLYLHGMCVYLNKLCVDLYIDIYVCVFVSIYLNIYIYIYRFVCIFSFCNICMAFTYICNI